VRRYHRAVRIALIDPGAYTPPYDHHLASSLGARGHEVHLLTSPFRFGETPPADRYHREELFFRRSSSLFRRAPRSRLRLPLKALEYASVTSRLRRRIDELNPDVVHFQWLLSRPDVDVRWLRPIAARRRTVFTAHDLWAMLRRRPEGWRAVFDAVDRVVVHSRRGVDELTRVGVEDERVARIPHAVFRSERAPETGASAGSTLLFFGLVRSYKGIDLLLRALPEIARHVPEARLVVAGDPLDPVGSLRGLADRLGVDDRVEWRLSYHPDREIDALLAAAAVVVLPYRRRVDSSGVLASALGRGRPVLVSDVGNLGETVREFGAGAVVPPDDVGALAAACVRLLSDDAVRRSAIEGALAARDALTWEVSAELHERLYASIRDHVSRPPRPLP
jgi:glycosyltransferase involved in cell wall biosynthesis